MKRSKPMNWQAVRAIILSGEADAADLLHDADPRLEKRFRKIDREMCKLLADVRRHFPDASYYTASGGFNLMLGPSHDDSERGLQELIALCGYASIGDGDF